MPHSLNSETLARIIDGSSIPAFVINNEHTIIHWNTALESLTGIKREEVIGTGDQWRPFYSQKRPVMADLIVDGATAEQFKSLYGEKCRQSSLIKDAYEAEDFFPLMGNDRKNGGKWLRSTASPIRNNEGRLIGAIESVEDVTDARVADENLRYYVKAITRAQEEERKRIARELHDDTAQVFGSISRQMDNFIRKSHHLTEEDVLFLKEILNQLNRGSEDLHRFCQGLRSSLLDDLGLIPALRSLLKSLQKDEGILVETKIVGQIRRYPPETESTLFHIVQEAINNIKKHAQASQVKVAITFIENGIKLEISDNGRGFELNGGIDRLPRKGKLGLAGIQERVGLLGGTLEVKSRPGKGTTLRVKV